MWTLNNVGTTGTQSVYHTMVGTTQLVNRCYQFSETKTTEIRYGSVHDAINLQLLKQVVKAENNVPGEGVTYWSV